MARDSGGAIDGPLVGVNILAVGLRDDRVAGGVRALLNTGATVIALDLGDLYDENPLHDEVAADVLACESHGRRFRLSSYGPRRSIWRDVLTAGAAPMVDRGLKFVGCIDAVYLGRWWGFDDYGVYRQLIEWLEQAGGELVVTEGRGQRAARAALALDCGKVRVDVVREPSPRTSVPAPIGAGRVAAELVAAGWSHLGTDVLDAEAADLRERGLDALAGAKWAKVGGLLGYHVELASTRLSSPGVGAVSASRLPRHRVLRPPAIVAFSGSGPDFSTVEVTSEDGVVVGVRFGWEIESFDEGETYRWLGAIDVSSGTLTLGAILAMENEQAHLVLEVAPGIWEVEEALGEPDTAGFRLRRSEATAAISLEPR